MSVNDAKRFLIDIIENDQMRRLLNSSDSRVEIRAILKDNSYEFSYEEINDAFVMVLSECEKKNLSEMVREVKKWWDLLMFVTPERTHEYV